MAPAEWTALEVSRWLASIGEAYADYGTEFVRNGITGEELTDNEFSESELKELGVASAMHRKRILKEARKIQ